ncbi:MAG: hypothetical protein ACLQVJ_10440 [Syntrophobacteraceae bacterium]
MASNIDNENDVKICAACRKRIDHAAIVCPYCRSNTNYRSLFDASTGQVFRRRRPVRFFVSLSIAFLLAAIAALYAFLLLGFLVGAGAGVIVFAVIGWLATSVSGARGFDELLLSCPKCDHQESYRWPGGSLEPGKTADCICVACGARLRVSIGP